MTVPRALRRAIAAGALVLIAALPASATAAWNQPVGGASPVNQASNQSAQETSLTAIAGVPHVAWREADGNNDEIRVARLNSAGTAWEQLVGGASPINQANNQTGFEPSLSSVGTTPYVAWAESDGTNDEIRVSRLNDAGTAWQQGPLWTGVSATSGGINQATNRNAKEPSLTSIGGVPYVAWSETDGTNDEIRVARLNAAGTGWEQPWTGVSATSGGINQATDRNAIRPSLTSIGGVPYVAWQEFDGLNQEIRVSRLNAAGTAWEQVVGGASPINQANNQNGVDPALAEIGGVPYVAWRETDGSRFQMRVSRLNTAGTAWEQLVGGASPINHASNQNAIDTNLTGVGGVPYVAWREADNPNFEVRVSRLNDAGTAWEELVGGASPINQASDLIAVDPSLAEIGGVPYVAWREFDTVNYEARVSRLEPEFTAATATPSATGATLTADVHTYGLPYPVGFEYGAALESETPTETTPAGAENATITREVDGLSPATDHQFRPFATAGVPQPRVLGTTGAFTTLATPTDPGGADTAGPDLKLSGKRKQELSRSVKVTATCTDEPCELDATGKLALPGGNSKNAAKALKLRPASANAGAGEPAKLKLRLGKRALKTANRALDGTGKAKAKIAVTAADALGNQTTLVRKVTIVAG